MKISTKGRYALRLMIDIAENSSARYVCLRDVACRQEISLKYLEQIISHLCRAGLIKSFRGAQGGYKLAKCPSEYTAGDVIRAIEGNIVPVSCLDDEENQCSRNEFCRSLSFWEGLSKVINDYVDSVTIADLMRVEANIKAAL